MKRILHGQQTRRDLQALQWILHSLSLRPTGRKNILMDIQRTTSSTHKMMSIFKYGWELVGTQHSESFIQLWEKGLFKQELMKLMWHWVRIDLALSSLPLIDWLTDISYCVDYDITAYGGTKSIVLTGTSFLGDRNPFMGLAWIVMGCVCTFLGVVFLGWHFFKPR